MELNKKTDQYWAKSTRAFAQRCMHSWESSTNWKAGQNTRLGVTDAACQPHYAGFYVIMLLQLILLMQDLGLIKFPVRKMEFQTGPSS